MCDELNAVDWTPVYTADDVNLAWQYSKKYLTQIFHRHASIITRNVKGKPALWLTKDLKAHMNECDNLLRKSRKTKTDSDINAYKRKCNFVNVQMRKAKSSYHKDSLQNNAHDPDKFWKSIKSIYNVNPGNTEQCKSFNLRQEYTINLN